MAYGPDQTSKDECTGFIPVFQELWPDRQFDLHLVTMPQSNFGSGFFEWSIRLQMWTFLDHQIACFQKLDIEIPKKTNHLISHMILADRIASYGVGTSW